MKTLLMTIVLLAAFSANANEELSNNFHWGINFSKGQEYDAVGLDLHTKSLFGFKNAREMQIRHSLLIGIDMYRIKNILTDSNGEFKNGSAISGHAGLRVFNSASSHFADIAVKYLSPDDEFASDSSIGMHLAIGYLIPYSIRENDSKVEHFKIALTYTDFLDEATKLTGKPDLFNGFAITLGGTF